MTPMKVAIFSDVHGNLSALNAVLDSIQQQPDLDEIVFAGDLCVFGPRPQACVQLILEQNIRTIAGNTDDWILRPPILSDELRDEQRKQRKYLRSICQWTQSQLTQNELNWIDELCDSFQVRFSPTGKDNNELLVVHANPVDLNQLIFPPENDQKVLYGRIRQSDAELAFLLNEVKASAIAYGHLHIPNIRHWKDLILLNVSSVSLPGDGDGRAKYAVISWTEELGWSAEHIRVPYDINPEIEAYRQQRPPGWQKQVDALVSAGFVPQIV
jgi:predicted phosphodiesterase